MREFVFSLIASNPVLFSILYPTYLTVLQMVTFKAMLWMRLPYKMRQFVLIFVVIVVVKLIKMVKHQFILTIMMIFGLHHMIYNISKNVIAQKRPNK